MISYVFHQIPLNLVNEGHGKVFLAHRYKDKRTADFFTAVRGAFEPELTAFYADRQTAEVGFLFAKIARLIEVSRIFVCDITEPNANLMIELGLAVGRNKPIILCHHESREIPEFLHGVSTLRYTDYRQLNRQLEELKRQYTPASFVANAAYCQLCQLDCPGKVAIPVEESNDCFLVDAPTYGYHMDDLLSAITPAVQSYDLSLATLNKSTRYQSRSLCSLVYAIRKSRVCIINYGADSEPIVPFLFGLSFALEVTPLLVTRVGTAIPSDLQGYERIEYENFGEIEFSISGGLDHALNELQRLQTPDKWNHYDTRTRDALFQIRRAVSATKSVLDQGGAFEDVLEVALAMALYAIRASAGSIMLMSADDYLQIVALVAPRVEMDAVGEWRAFNVDEGICGYVVRTGHPYLCANVTEDEYYAKRTYDRNLSSLVSVPILQNSTVLGVVNADSREINFFRDDDIGILESVAELLAPLIGTYKNQWGDFLRTDEPHTQLHRILMQDAACISCGSHLITLSFERIDDEKGLRYRMLSECLKCKHRDEIRTYMLRSVQ